MKYRKNKSNMENLVINKKYSKSFWCAKVLHRLPLITGVSSFYNKKRHKIINDKLLPIMDCAVRISPKIDKKVNSKNIWIFWWQGKDRMPSLVKKCYQSVIRNKGRRHVILITKDNIKQYATIPDYIYEKVNNGEITLTHLSDILRFNLLNEYGGLWIDSTIYLTDSLDVFDTEKIVTCGGYPKDGFFNISYGRWTGFFIGGPQDSELFNFMDNFFRIYWKYNDKLIDYFLIDYALNYAWNNNLGGFNFSKKNINPDLFKLQGILKEKYDSDLFKKITKNTRAFKLSYKKKINTNNEQSFYCNLK